MDPIAVGGLAIGFLLYATFLGNPLRVLLLREDRLEYPERSLAIRWTCSLVTGLALIPLIYLNLGLVPGWAGPITGWTVTLGAAAANVALYHTQFLRLGHVLRKSRAGLDRYDMWFFAIATASFAFLTSPLVGLWVTPGDDGELYSLITQRFIATGGIPVGWGAVADPSWYEERTHLLLPGFSGTVASVVYLVPVGIPTAVSIIASVYRSLTALSLFLLVYALSQKKLPALLSMLIYGVTVVEPPIAWFNWGGMAELSAISLLPVAVAASYAIYVRGVGSWRYLTWVSIVIGGMSLLHPYALFYYLAFLIPFTLFALLRKRSLNTLVIWTPAIFGLILASAPILHALGPEASIAPLYSLRNPGWTPVLSWSMPWTQVFHSVWWRITTVYGGATVGLLIVGLILVPPPFWSGPKQTSLVLGLWYAGMLFLHENNPNGLFVVPFPFWYRVDANRTFGVTSILVGAFIGLSLHQIALSFRPTQLTATTGTPRFPRDRERQRWILILALVLLLIGTQVLFNASMLIGERVNSPITAGDIQAFHWIKDQTPPDSTFFVSQADAGGWIHLYTSRRVVFPFGVVTNYTLLDEYSAALSAFVANASSPLSLDFMLSLGVTDVYVGPARIYGRPGFDAAKILGSGLFDVLYHRGDVWIFHLNRTAAGRFGASALWTSARHVWDGSVSIPTSTWLSSTRTPLAMADNWMATQPTRRISSS